MRNKVVLPEPDGPSRATNSPAPTCRLTSSTAVKSAELFADIANLDTHAFTPRIAASSSIIFFAASVTKATKLNREATENAAAKLYSL